MGCDEHVVGLNGCADEETGQWEDGEAKTSRQVLVCKGLNNVSYTRKQEYSDEESLRRSSSPSPGHRGTCHTPLALFG